MPITPPAPGALVASSWGIAVTSALNAAHVQAGAATLTINSGFGTVVFPISFASAPIVVATFAGNVGGNSNQVTVRNITATTVDVYVYEANGTPIPNGSTRTVNWIAVGPRA